MGETVGVEATPRQDDGPRLAELRALLEYGMEYRATREDRWRESEAQYEGDHWGTEAFDDPTADLITINLSFSTVNTIIPYITSEEPRFLVSPYSQDATVENARLQQAWLNRLWRKQSTGGQEALESSAEDYLIYGDGYMKVSYSLEESMASSGQVDSKTIAEIFVDRLDPWDLFIDPMADGLHNARWICHRIYTTKDEIAQDEKYDDVDLDELTGEPPDTAEDAIRTDRTAWHGETGQEWVTLYEFYDLVHDEMWTFGLGGDMPLRVVEGVSLAPIVQIPNYRIPRSPYHMGELEQIRPMQEELNKSRSQLITHRRRNVAKYLIKEDAVTKEGKEALQSPIVNQMVPVFGDQPLDALVKPASLQPLPPEAYASADQAERDIYEISGVNEYLRGASPEIRRTATEATIIEGASNVKTRSKLADVERAVRKVGALIIETAKDVYPQTDVDEMAMYLTGGEAEQIARDTAAVEADSLLAQGDMAGSQEARILGQNSDVVVTPTEDIFVGIYEVEVESGSTEMRSPSFKEGKFREMANTLTANYEVLAQAGVNINLRKAYEMWFEAMMISDIDGMFQSQADVAMQAPQAPPGEGAPPAGPPGGMPPEMAAMLAGGAPPGGEQPQEGVPNDAAAAPPLEPITDETSGLLAPV